MRNLLIIITTIIFCFGFNICKAQNIIISGKIDSSVTNLYGSKELILTIKSTTNSDSRGQQKKVAIDSNGNFNARITASDTLSYIAFEMIDENREKLLRNIGRTDNRMLSEVYLFQVGDSIKVNINLSGAMSFTGIGSDKLNCQWKIFNISPLPKVAAIRSGELLFAKQLNESLMLSDKILNSTIDLQLSLLESYKSKFSNEIYDLLYLDIISSSEYDIIRPLRQITYSLKEKNTRLILQQYHNSYLKRQRIEISNFDTTYLAKSAYYAELLFEKELNYFRLTSTSKTGIEYGDSFVNIFETLKNKYHGILRDKLLLICFERLNRFYSAESKYFIDDALQIMNNNKYKEVLTEIKKKQYAAFPFELQDVNGNIHALNDFKGKLIIVDFWFTGCVGCISLNQKMSEIIEKYKRNRNIVFLTVSVDKDKSIWRKSIIGGKYTSSETINLYTNGLGRSHPIIQNYNFKAYPSQILIGKNGDLITSSPPRPDAPDPNNYRGFIEIIEANLNKSAK